MAECKVNSIKTMWQLWTLKQKLTWFFKNKCRLGRKEIENYKIGIIHGYGHPNKLIDLVTEIFKNDNVNLIIFGHSHSALNEKRGNIIYFNPGSPTDKTFALHNSYGIIEINDKIEAKIVRI